MLQRVPTSRWYQYCAQEDGKSIIRERSRVQGRLGCYHVDERIARRR